MFHFKKILALLLAVTVLITALSACSNRTEEAEEESEASQAEVEEPDYETVATVIPDRTEDVAEAMELNEHTIGWLEIPSLEVDEVVVMYTDNQYYERLDFNQEYHFPGIIYADRRSEIGDGTRAELGQVTTLYGHALTDDPDDTKYDYYDKFGPLDMLRDEEIAKQTPYFFFSTDTDKMAFEIFAIFDISISIPYNRNDLEEEDEYYYLIGEELLPRPLYNYDIEISEDDKFMVLSTCIYELPDKGRMTYPNNYRLGVIGRLVEDTEPLREEATFEVNEDIMQADFIDPEND